ERISTRHIIVEVCDNLLELTISRTAGRCHAGENPCVAIWPLPGQIARYQDFHAVRKPVEQLGTEPQVVEVVEPLLGGHIIEQAIALCAAKRHAARESLG